MFRKKILEKREYTIYAQNIFFRVLYDFRTNEIKVVLYMYIQNTGH